MVEEKKKCYFLTSPPAGFNPKYPRVEDLPPCDGDVENAEKVLVIPATSDSPERICFIPPKQLDLFGIGGKEEDASLKRAVDIKTDAEFVKAQVATSNFEGYYKICRSENNEPAVGGKLYAFSTESLLRNSCNQGTTSQKTTFKPLSVGLNREEKLALIALLKNQTSKYCMDNDSSFSMDAGLLAINFLENYKNKVEKYAKTAGAAISSEKAKEICEAIDIMMEPAKWDRWMKRFQMAAAIGAPIGVIVGILSLLLFKEMMKMQKALNAQMSGKKPPILPTLEDLNAKARAGELEPIPSRLAGEQKDIVATLAPGKQAKPILVGENGTNKTTVAKAIAQAVVDGKFVDGIPIPDYVRGKEFVYVSAAKEFAAPEDGQFITVVEQKFKQLIEECKRTGKIPVIDEIHAIIRAGRTGQEPVGPLGDILKAEPDFMYIGMTTPDEYRMIERDKALPSRMVRISHPTPTCEQGRADFIETRWFLEKRTGLSFPDETLDAVLSYLDRDKSTNFPRKLFEFFKRLKDRMGVQGIKSNVVTPVHAREYITYKTEAALTAAMEQARKEMEATRRPSPQKIVEIEKTSIESFLSRDVLGWNELNQLRQAEVVELIRRGWAELSELDKSAFIDSSEEPYTIPKRFIIRLLQENGQGSIVMRYGLGFQAPELDPSANTNGSKSGGPKGPGEPPSDSSPPTAGTAGNNAPDSAGTPEGGESTGGRAARTAVSKISAAAVQPAVAEPTPQPVFAEAKSAIKPVAQKHIAQRLGGGGQVALAGVVVGLDGLEHNEIISPTERRWVDGSLFAGFAVFHHALFAELLPGIPGAWLGHGAATKIADAVGIEDRKEDLLPHRKVVGTMGGLMGFVASLKLFMQSEAFRKFHAATATGVTEFAKNFSSKIGSKGLAVEEAVRNVAVKLRSQPKGFAILPTGATLAAVAGSAKTALTAEIAAGAAATIAVFAATAGAGLLTGYGLYKSGATEAVGVNGASGSWLGSTSVGDFWYNIGATNFIANLMD